MKRLAGISATFLFASLILAFSILESSQIQYAFGQTPSPTPVAAKDMDIKYELVYPGPIAPDSPFWPFKAVRDRLWVVFAFNNLKKANTLLTIADKRLAQSTTLFKDGNSDLGASVLVKAEKYLEEAKYAEQKARTSGADTSEFLSRFALATLKHRQVMDEIMNYAPEDAKPMIVQAEDYPKKLFLETKSNLVDMGRISPQNPFDSF